MRISLFFLLLICLSAQAQYEPFHQDVLFHFQKPGDDGFQMAMYMDSVITESDRTVYYPFRMLSKFYNPSGCVDEEDAHWSCDRLEVFSNGHHIFYTEGGDSILIKSRSKINEPWIAWKSETNTMMGVLVAHNIDTFLDVVDSIKTFKFRLVDSFGNEVTHGINNLQLNLSKHYGYSTIINLGLFPISHDYTFGLDLNNYLISGHSELSQGYHNLTWSEVIDYNVGDEFHIKERQETRLVGWPWNHVFMKHRVLNKSESNDKVNYLIEESKLEIDFYYHPEYDTVNRIESFDTIIISYSKINNNFDLVSGCTYINEIGDPTSNLSFSNDFGRAKHYDYLIIRELSDSCWRAYYEQKNYHFIENAGGPYYNNGDHYSGFYARSLEYAKRDSIEIGIPFDFVITIDTMVQDTMVQDTMVQDTMVQDTMVQDTITQDTFLKLTIFPNPVFDQLTIAWNPNQKINEVRIYDTAGMLVREINIEGEHSITQCLNLSPGIFICVVLYDTSIIEARPFLIMSRP